MESGGKAVTKRYRKKITVALSLVLPVIVLFAILNCFTTYVFYEDYKYRNLLGGLYRENPVKSRNYEAVKSSKKWENVGNSYIIPALLLYRYSYI